MSRRRILLTLLVLCLLLAGCEDNEEVVEKEHSSEVTEQIEIEGQQETEEPITIEESMPVEPLDLSTIPAYEGEPYYVINDNYPAFLDQDKVIAQPFELYSPLDNLGRCGAAYANICGETMPTEEREAIGEVKPSGWHLVKYNSIIDGNYLYNRCHLIGFQLSGENANEENLITGTRYLNVIGMLPFEDKVSSYVKETENHVLYRVTPIFEGDNLVAAGVQMEGWSVEDEGEGICFNVFCYNVQPGIEIDYATGDSREIEGYADTTETTTNVTEDSSETTQKSDYVINLNTGKFHRPGCRSVADMKEKNKKNYHGTMEEIEQQGYKPCKRCF